MALILVVGGGGGYSSATISSGIAFTGLVNGTNTTFVPALTPHQVFLGGVLQKPTVDYNMVSGSVVFTTAPPSTDDAGNPTWIAMY